ncbi:MAG: CPBP family intramembrane glutamic endopeptidase [Allomuricauda sp.]|jgi:membrane protease YdiL (CAAX protease family)
MKTSKRILSIIIVLLIPVLSMLWFTRHESSGYASIELIAYPLIFGGVSIVAIYLLKTRLLKEQLIDFNSGNGSWYTDILWGLLLTATYFILFFAFRATLSNILAFHPNSELLDLMLDMRQSPLLIAIWFGPVLWLGVALYEELVRAFLLTSIWKEKNSLLWITLSILLTSIVFGLAHYSQGPYGIVTIGLKSFIPAFFFYHKRRLMPLVYAHVLYDGLQVAMFLITYQS